MFPSSEADLKAWSDNFWDQFRHDNDYECLSRALYMNTPFPIPGFAMFFPSILVICLTQYLGSITPGVKYASLLDPITRNSAERHNFSAPQQSTVNITQSVEDTDAEIELPSQEETPPPYNETPDTIAKPTKTTKPRTSAELFVIGTACLLVIIFCLVTIALATQATIFCQDWSPLSAGPQGLLWFFYLSPLLTSTRALGCWVILLRDLWGPAAKRKFPVSEKWFFLPFGMAGRGMVILVEGCQRRFCGGGIEVEDMESEGVIDLEEGSGEDRMEGNVGLISGIGK